MEQPYYKYSKFLKDKYGEKTYKLPVNLPTTCPNRDGNLGTKGCFFVAKKEQTLKCCRKVCLLKINF